MSRLLAEIHRLFGAETLDPTAPEPARLRLTTSSGQTRTLLLEVKRGSDWPALAALLQGVEEALELPAPAVAVAPQAGFQLWFPLQAAVDAATGQAFLEGLRARYLAEAPPVGLRLLPGGGQEWVDRVPELDAASGKWSAFIDPTMGSMFADEAGLEMGLEMAPNPERQADMLAAITPIPPAALERALARLRPAPTTPATAPGQAPAMPAPGLAGPWTDPRAFLLAVMNDASAPLRERIEAAKALLADRDAPGQHRAS